MPQTPFESRRAGGAASGFCPLPAPKEGPPGWPDVCTRGRAPSRDDAEYLFTGTPPELVVFHPSQSSTAIRPRSSGDRASASGAGCAGSNPAGGTFMKVPKTPPSAETLRSGSSRMCGRTRARKAADGKHRGPHLVGCGPPSLRRGRDRRSRAHRPCARRYAAHPRGPRPRTARWHARRAPMSSP